MQVLILFAALSTCDPGNVMDAVKAAKEKNVHVSIVGMAAEVRICSVFTKVVALPPLSAGPSVCPASNVVSLLAAQAASRSTQAAFKLEQRSCPSVLEERRTVLHKAGMLLVLNGVVYMLQETGGEYGIALNERHFEELVFSHARPPPSRDSEKHASLVSL